MTHIYTFNPEELKRIVKGPVGVEYGDSWSLEDSARKGSLIRSTSMLLSTVLECLLVGCYDDANRLLIKTISFADRSIELRNKNGPPTPLDQNAAGAEAMCHSNRALCRWLLNNEGGVEDLKQAVEFDDLYYSTQKADKISLSMVLPTYLDAGLYRLVVDRFTKRFGVDPLSISRISNCGQMACILSEQQLNGSFSDADMKKKLHKFLKRFIHKNLHEGHYIDVARWMKIAYWNNAEPRPAAIEAFLRCYDFLPFDPPPPPSEE